MSRQAEQRQMPDSISKSNRIRANVCLHAPQMGAHEHSRAAVPSGRSLRRALLQSLQHPCSAIHPISRAFVYPCSDECDSLILLCF